jgi:hypothetical protein
MLAHLPGERLQGLARTGVIRTRPRAIVILDPARLHPIPAEQP